MRLITIQAVALLFVASSALAGPADHAFTLRLPFGGGADDGENRVQVDILQIRQTLQKIQDDQSSGPRPVVVDPQEMEAEPPGSTQTKVNMEDPNLNGRVANYNVQIPVDKNLHPVDANTLFDARIRPQGTDTFSLPSPSAPSVRVKADH